ncbi:MAG: hypothetical protein RLN85_18085, partial [Pseudomonadales bacterium]
LAAIILGNGIFMIYRWFEVFTLFDRQLSTVDHIQQDLTKGFAGVIAIILVNAVLIVAVNAHTLKAKRAAEISAFLFSLFLNILFWQAWQGDLQAIAFKLVISVTFALLDGFFAYLFIEKWTERRALIEGEEELQDTRKILTELATKKHKAQQDLEQLKDEIGDMRLLVQDTTCMDCGREFQSTEARNKHWHDEHARQMIGS